MRVAITGATGHIGNCLVRELLKQGAQVKALVHDFRTNLDGLNVEFVSGSLLDKLSLDDLCKGADVIFHLAAVIGIDNKKSELLYSTNITGTKNIVESAEKAGIKKFIHLSSIDAFQTSNGAKIDESTPLIESRKAFYSFSKAESERIVLSAVENGLNAVILNPTAVIGPFDYRESLLGQAIRKIYRNNIPFLVNGGYNWVDVRDVASAAIQAMEYGRRGERYIISGEFCNLKDLSSLISKISGCRIPGFVPVSVARLAAPVFRLTSAFTKKEPLYTQHSLDLLVSSPSDISNEKARKELNYNPHSLEQTLIDTFDWYKQNNYLT